MIVNILKALSRKLLLIFLVLIGIILVQDNYSQAKGQHRTRETSTLFSRLHTLSIHVPDTITHDSVFHFLSDKLKLPVYYFPVKAGARKYAGVYAGNLVLEPCGPYTNFVYASDSFRAIFFGLTFEPFKTIGASAKGLEDRKITHEEGEDYIYISDPRLCGENMTISFIRKSIIEDKRNKDSLFLANSNADGPGIEYVKEIRIGYKDNDNLQEWKELISPGKLIRNKWSANDNINFSLIKSGIKEVQGLTFKVKSIEEAKQYFLKNNMLFNYSDREIRLNESQSFGLQIFFTE